MDEEIASDSVECLVFFFLLLIFLYYAIAINLFVFINMMLALLWWCEQWAVRERNERDGFCLCEDSHDDILQWETEKEAEQEDEKSYSIILIALY